MLCFRIRQGSVVLGLIGLMACVVSVKAQIASGPFVRFMGNNNSNGLSTTAGPGSSPSFTTYTGGGGTIPVVVNDTTDSVVPGKILTVTTSSVNCYNENTGAQIWSESFAYLGVGQPVITPPAIGNEGTAMSPVYVVYVTTQNGVAALYLDQNGTHMPGSIKWSYAPIGTSALPKPPISSPVVGPDGTVYLSSSNESGSGYAYVYAMKNGTSGGFLKWQWGGGSSVVTNAWGQPVLFVGTTYTYVIVTGSVEYSYNSMTGASDRGLICICLADETTSGIKAGEFDFPNVSEAHDAFYSSAGNPSLSPDASKLIVPWQWQNGTTWLSGIACLAVSSTGTLGNGQPNWPALPANVNTAPSVYDVSITGTPTTYTFTAAVDDSYAYCTNLLGNSIIAHSLTSMTGVSSATTAFPTGQYGGVCPALDEMGAFDSVWVATKGTNNEMLQYKLTGLTLNQTVNVSSPVIGLGAAIGTLDDLALIINGTGSKNLGVVR